MSDGEEAHGEDPGLEDILRQAVSSASSEVLKRSEAVKSELRREVEQLKSEVHFLRGKAAERKYELRFSPKGGPGADASSPSTQRIVGTDGVRSVVVVQGRDGTTGELEALRASLPAGVLMVAVPPGVEISILEVVPAPEK